MNEVQITNRQAEFLAIISNETSFARLEDKFDALAYCLMNYLCLAVGENEYRITECEIYYQSEGDHNDPYVHGEDQQLTSGQLYLNRAGGLDITFGNTDRKIYGGILIRGVKNLKTNTYINKIQKIVSEVFESLGNILTGERVICLREPALATIEPEKPIVGTRIGLRRKDNDNANYLEKPYRYIVELTKGHKFKNKEAVVMELLASNQIKGSTVGILGYNLTIND